MALGRNDVPEAVKSELLKLWPASAAQVTPAEYRGVFDILSDGRYQVILASLQAAARWTAFGSGTELPNRDPFQGGKVTIVPVMLGESRSFQFQTVEEVQAAIGTDLKSACDNWAMAQENTRDLQCTDMLKDDTTTGYDGKILFATDHPQMSRYPSGGGTALSNTDATAAAITHAVVRDFVKLFEDTNGVTESGDKMNNKLTHLACTSMGQYMELLPVLRSVQRAGTANNDLNALNELGITPLFWRNLAGATEYMYAFSRVPGAGGLVYVNKQDTIIETQRNFKTKMTEASAHLQGAPSYTDFRKVARKALSAL